MGISTAANTHRRTRLSESVHSLSDVIFVFVSRSISSVAYIQSKHVRYIIRIWLLSNASFMNTFPQTSRTTSDRPARMNLNYIVHENAGNTLVSGKSCEFFFLWHISVERAFAFNSVRESFWLRTRKIAPNYLWVIHLARTQFFPTHNSFRMRGISCVHRSHELHKFNQSAHCMRSTSTWCRMGNGKCANRRKKNDGNDETKK